MGILTITDTVRGGVFSFNAEKIKSIVPFDKREAGDTIEVSIGSDKHVIFADIEYVRLYWYMALENKYKQIKCRGGNELYDCNICGGTVDLSDAKKPTVQFKNKGDKS